MAANSNISWTDHTASPWYGCQHAVLPDGTEHPGCLHCYAEMMAKRNPGTLGVWGPRGTRVLSKSFWDACRSWNRKAESERVRRKVFPSVDDPFEDWQGDILDSKGEVQFRCACGAIGPITGNNCPQCNRADGSRLATMCDLRTDLFALIDECLWLDFLLLTKRPQNVRRMWPSKYDQSAAKRICTNGGNAHPHYRDNAWIGTSISDQPTAETFIVELLQCRDLSPVLFLSAEPLLGPIDFAMRWKPPITSALSEGIDWVIIGGESGSGHRTCDLACITSLVNQCRNADVACFVKQDYGPRPGMQGRIPDDIWAVKQFPRVEVPS